MLRVRPATTFRIHSSRLRALGYLSPLQYTTFKQHSPILARLPKLRRRSCVSCRASPSHLLGRRRPAHPSAGRTVSVCMHARCGSSTLTTAYATLRHPPHHASLAAGPSDASQQHQRRLSEEGRIHLAYIQHMPRAHASRQLRCAKLGGSLVCRVPGAGQMSCDAAAARGDVRLGAEEACTL